MHFLYKITNQINNKVYIGQTIDVNDRWSAHKSKAKVEKPVQYISRAIAKYGVENFMFEVLATCKTQEDTDEIESILISQYNSRDKQYGYNVKPGGNVAPHAEETKQKQREATIRQIAEKGHPAQGRVVTQETRDLMRKIRLENPIEYTDEIRKNMSDAHIGKVIPEEQRKKMSEGIQEWWDQRNAERFATGEIYCHAPGCEVSGKAKYKIINGVRYCNKHGLRMLRYGRLDSLSD